MDASKKQNFFTFHDLIHIRTYTRIETDEEMMVFLLVYV